MSFFLSGLFRKAASRKSGIAAEMLLAKDGKGAVSLLSDPQTRSQVGLVFLDLKLPMLNGFDVLRWLRRENFLKLLRVVVLSGSAFPSDKQLAQELGASDYVVKPITPEAIRRSFGQLKL
jgi:CheY-like chemotaxis protein